jgi:hypothetical protein
MTGQVHLSHLSPRKSPKQVRIWKRKFRICQELNPNSSVILPVALTLHGVSYPDFCNLFRCLQKINFKQTFNENSDTKLNLKKKNTPWLESARELYRLSDCRLSMKLVPTFADRGCHVVSRTDPYGHILGFLDRSRYFFFQVAPQLYSWSWVYTIPDPFLLKKIW